jgi:hypothetical protein
MPVVIIAGEQDGLVDIDTQSARLHSEISQSTLHRIPENGHMIHQTATNQVMAAVTELARAGPTRTDASRTTQGYVRAGANPEGSGTCFEVSFAA